MESPSLSSLLARAPYQFDPAVSQCESAHVLTYFSGHFSTLYTTTVATDETIIIFHDWWFAPYGRDKVANAATIFELADYVRNRYRNELVLPHYFADGHRYATTSECAFAHYPVTCHPFAGHYRLQSAAA